MRVKLKEIIDVNKYLGIFIASLIVSIVLFQDYPLLDTPSEVITTLLRIIITIIITYITIYIIKTYLKPKWHDNTQK